MNHVGALGREASSPDGDRHPSQRSVVERLGVYASRANSTCSCRAPGHGKTTAAMALAMDVFGEFRRNLLEMNASDERNWRAFEAKSSSSLAPHLRRALQVIFLDEADALTNDAQGALRRIMEQFAETCRFILSCNYSSKIIEPFNRGALFRFRPLPDAKCKIRLHWWLHPSEIVDDAVEAITRIAQGDLRKRSRPCKWRRHWTVPSTVD